MLKLSTICKISLEKQSRFYYKYKYQGREISLPNLKLASIKSILDYDITVQYSPKDIYKRVRVCKLISRDRHNFITKYKGISIKCIRLYCDVYHLILHAENEIRWQIIYNHHLCIYTILEGIDHIITRDIKKYVRRRRNMFTNRGSKITRKKLSDFSAIDIEYAKSIMKMAEDAINAQSARNTPPESPLSCIRDYNIKK
jgi:hypothetical protein